MRLLLRLMAKEIRLTKRGQHLISKYARTHGVVFHTVRASVGSRAWRADRLLSRRHLGPTPPFSFSLYLLPSPSTRPAQRLPRPHLDGPWARVCSAATSLLRGRRAAMALVQAGMGLTRVVVLVGAGVAGSVVLRNGRLAEILGELQVRRVPRSCALMAACDPAAPYQWGKRGDPDAPVLMFHGVCVCRRY